MKYPKFYRFDLSIIVGLESKVSDEKLCKMVKHAATDKAESLTPELARRIAVELTDEEVKALNIPGRRSDGDH